MVFNDLLENHRTQTKSPDESQPKSKSKPRLLDENYAYNWYIRLRLHAAICHCQSKKKSNENKKNNMFSNFYLFCDKDKSGKLDKREETIALLTFFKYIDHQFNYNNLLPIHYDSPSSELGCQNEDQFRTLIIDTLTYYLITEKFDDSNNLDNRSFDENNAKINEITKNIQKTLTEDLYRDEDKDETPYSFTNISIHIISFILCFILLPFAVFGSIVSNLSTDNTSTKSEKRIRIILIILLSIVMFILSSILYLIIFEMAIYYIYYDDSRKWHVSPLEIFWPFTLLFSITLIGYLRGSPTGAQDNYRKNQILNLYYNQAELEMLENQVNVIILKDGKRKPAKISQVKHQFETLEKESKLDKVFRGMNRKKRNYWMKLRQNLHQIYTFEFVQTKLKEIIAKIVLISIVIIIGILHGFVPTIYRACQSDYVYPTNITKPPLVQLIEITFIIDSIIIYLIFLSSIIYTYHLFHIVLIQLKKVMRKTTNNNEYDIASLDQPYLDLKDSTTKALDLFLCQIRNIINIRNTLEYQVNFILF